MKTFFGLKEGQTISGFGQELKALTDKDKMDFVKWFNDAGMPTTTYGGTPSSAST